MIPYKQAKYKELLGDFRAKIEAVTMEENSKYYDPSKDNSTEYILNIKFILEDPETLEPIEFTQKYVAPLTGGNGLFQQLLDVIEILPDVDGGQIDEQQFVGLNVVVTLEKNKKGYSFVKSVIRDEKKPARAVSKKPQVKVEDDLPFN